MSEHSTSHGTSMPIQAKAVAFPLQDTDIKAFTIALSEAGFSLPRIMNNLYKGLCMWVSTSIITFKSLHYQNSTLKEVQLSK